MEIQVEGRANSDKVEVGILNAQAFPKDKIIKRVVVNIAIFWGLALFSVLIPVLHFVLVPLFFILGIVFAVNAFGDKEEIIGGHIKCPHCGANVEFKKAPLAWPHKEICQNCASYVQVAPSNRML